MAGRWFSPFTLVSSTIKTDCHDITEILLKVALNTIIPTLLDRYTSTHLEISILSEILGAQYTKILDLSFTFDYPIICKTVKIYWPIQWTGHHSFVYGCKHSPFIQIFDLLVLWASKSIIVLAQTQIYYLDQKEKNRNFAPSYFLTSGHSATFVAALYCSKTSCAWNLIIQKKKFLLSFGTDSRLRAKH